MNVEEVVGQLKSGIAETVEMKTSFVQMANMVRVAESNCDALIVGIELAMRDLERIRMVAANGQRRAEITTARVAAVDPGLTMRGVDDGTAEISFVDRYCQKIRDECVSRSSELEAMKTKVQALRPGQVVEHECVAGVELANRAGDSLQFAVDQLLQ